MFRGSRHYSMNTPWFLQTYSLLSTWSEIENRRIKSIIPGPQIRVRNWKLFFLFLNQNICCGYSKEPSPWDGSFGPPKHMFKPMAKKKIAILRKLFLLNWPYAYYPTTFCCKNTPPENTGLLMYKWAVTRDFQQCGILKSADSDEPVLPPFKLRNSKWCSGSR